MTTYELNAHDFETIDRVFKEYLTTPHNALDEMKARDLWSRFRDTHSATLTFE